MQVNQMIRALYSKALRPLALILVLALALFACRTIRLPDGTVIREFDRDAAEYAVEILPYAEGMLRDTIEYREQLRLARQHTEDARQIALINQRMAQAERSIEFLERILQAAERAQQ